MRPDIAIPFAALVCGAVCTLIRYLHPPDTRSIVQMYKDVWKQPRHDHEDDRRQAWRDEYERNYWKRMGPR